MTNDKRTFADFCQALARKTIVDHDSLGGVYSVIIHPSDVLALIREYRHEIDEAIEEEAREEGRREIWAILRKDAEKRDAQGGLERGAAPSEDRD